LNIEEKIAEYADYARDNTRTSLPKTMKTSVIINAKAILPLFSPLLSHSSGQFFHDNISFFKKGEEVLRGNKIKGETFNLSSNPLIPYGLKSVPFDRDGIALSHNEVIKNSKLENIWAPKRYASYLGIVPTGDFSNLEISTGNRSFQELLTATDKPVYYIVKFSLLLPDNVSGDFATEIRFGYEITPAGEKIPIKGGSITGNIFEMFSNAGFSKEKIMEGAYIGPKAIRFEGISISGS
jgi:PmbA protein